MFTLARLRRLRRVPPGTWRRTAAALLTGAALLGAAEAGLRRWDPALNRTESFGSAARRALTPETRVLITGTSHVFTGVRADRLGVPAANVAASGLDYQLAEPLLNAALDQAPATELVLIEVDGYPLHADLAERGLVPVTDLIDFGVDPAAVAAVSGRPVAATDAAPGGAGGVFGPPAVFARPAWTPTRALDIALKARGRVHGPGFLGWTTAFNNLTDGGRARHHDRVAVGDPAENLPALLAMVDAAAARGADVILFRTPHAVQYRTAAPERFGPAVKAAAAAIRARRPGVPFWDDYADPRFTAADYFDGDHLNVRGADRYTKILGDRVRERLGVP